MPHDTPFRIPDDGSSTGPRRLKLEVAAIPEHECVIGRDGGTSARRTVPTPRSETSRIPRSVYRITCVDGRTWEAISRLRFALSCFWSS